MNNDQLINLVQTILKLVAGALAAKGLGDSSLWEGISGGILALVTWYASHKWNATPASSPTAVITSAPTSSQSGFARPAVLFVLASFCLILAAMIGCAHLQPGADPVVVNVERVQTVAAPTFDLVLSTDDTARPLWAQKAPAFHDFCEWLRQPQTVGLANGAATNVPRAIALQLNLDNVKLAYKSGRAGSNDVFTALATLNSAIQQANAWLIVVTNAPPPASAPAPLPPSAFNVDSERIAVEMNSTDH